MSYAAAGARRCGAAVRTPRRGVAGPGIRAPRIVTRASTALPADVKALTPVGARLFVKLQEAKEESTGGILLPDAAKTKPPGGEVVQAGGATEVKVGDKVVYSKFAGTEVSLGGVEHVILKEDDVAGILESDDPKDMKPTADGVLVQVDESADKTEGGIFLTGSTKEKPSTGKVVAVGPGKKDEDGNLVAVDIAAGSTVLFSKYSGIDFQAADGTELILIKDSDVLATLELDPTYKPSPVML